MFSFPAFPNYPPLGKVVQFFWTSKTKFCAYDRKNADDDTDGCNDNYDNNLDDNDDKNYQKKEKKI